MPLYEYGCEKCGHVVEKLQSSPNSPPPGECAKCGTEGSMQRLISNTSFQLKGSGWYVTDYKSSGSSSGGTNVAESSGSESTTESSSAAGSETSSAATESAD